jgi:hypothetical protein
MIEYIVSFLVIWLVLLAIAKYVVRWPKELSEIRKRCTTKEIVVGLFRPTTLGNVLTPDQIRVFKKARMMYFSGLMLLILGLASLGYYVEYRVRTESPLFNYDAEE